MLEARHSDRHLHTAFHLDEQETELLLKFHEKEKTIKKGKLENLYDKAIDGGTKYDDQISKIRSQLEYHDNSIFQALKYLDYLRIRKTQTTVY